MKDQKFTVQLKFFFNETLFFHIDPYILLDPLCTIARLHTYRLTKASQSQAQIQRAAANTFRHRYMRIVEIKKIFESGPSEAWLAQSVERWTFNPTVVGSSPTLGSISFTNYFKGVAVVKWYVCTPLYQNTKLLRNF